MGDNSFVHAVDFDQLNVETPEQVDLYFPVAGIGSRFVAILVDSLIVLLGYFGLFLIAAATLAGVGAAGGSRGPLGIEKHLSTAMNWWMAGLFFIVFLINWGYFALFEGLWHGQTPGKRLMKLRVIKDSGRAITMFESLARNLLRVVDYLPGMYLVGVVTMLCNRSQKRLGDFVAGTMVVHDRADEQPALTHQAGHHSRTFTANVYQEAPVRSRLKPLGQTGSTEEQPLPADAVGRLRAEDLHLIETFFSRALDLSVERRAELALRVAATVSGRMEFHPPPGTDPERLLERIAYRMRGQGRF